MNLKDVLSSAASKLKGAFIEIWKDVTCWYKDRDSEKNGPEEES